MIIKNGTICDFHIEKRADIRVDRGKIVQIGDNLKSNGSSEEIFDANGLYIMPSMIDLNVKLFNSVLNMKNISYLTQKSLKGGVATSLLMPNTTPQIDSDMALEFVNSKSLELNLSRVYPAIAGLNQDKKLSDILTLVDRGAKGIYIDSNISANLIKRLFEYSKMLNIPTFILSHNEELSVDGVMNDSHLAFELGLAPILEISETSEVAKVSEIAKSIGNRVVMQSISTDRALEIISKIDNLYSEISINHLALSDRECQDFNTYAKIFPPLRSENERLKLIQRVKSNEVDILTSMHSPISAGKKDLAFAEAGFGVDTLENYFSLCYTFLVKSGDISLNRLSEITSFNPSKLLNFKDRGAIKEGYIADLMIIDLDRELESKSSLYRDYKLFAEVKEHLIDGEFKL